MPTVEARVFILAAGILALIAAGIFITQAATGRRIEGVWRMFGIEVATASWILVPAALGAPFFLGMMALTGAAAAYEISALHHARGRRIVRVIPPLAALLFVALAALPPVVPLLAAFAALCILLLFLPVVTGQIDGSHERSSTTLAACVYPGLCVALAARLLLLPHGFGAVAFLFIVLEVNDALGFLTGRFFGRRLLAPRLSPRKTVAGSVGGLTAATLVGAALSFLLPGFSLVSGAGLALVLALLGQASDLAASAIKRDAGVKDFANTIPTQGGVLDVYDAFILVAPFWFLALHVMW